MTSLPPQHRSTETLPASRTFFAVRLGIVALLIPIAWLWLGVLAGVATALALAWDCCCSRLAPSFSTSGDSVSSRWFTEEKCSGAWSIPSAPVRHRALAVSSLYTKVGRRQRWWYPAGWPAQGGIPPAFASSPGGRALSASELADLLNNRLARARAG